MACAIQLKGIEKTYGSFQLGPIDMEIPRGVAVAVVGPNGSGKSTLFGMLMNLVQPDRGDIEFSGGRRYPGADRSLKHSIGYMPEVFSIPEENATVDEWVHFVRQWYPDWDQTLMNRLMRDYELEGCKKIKALSKGTQQRLIFALAMAHRPELLLLDEPSSGLDPFVWRRMMDDIRAYMDAGTGTVLFATHAMEEVRRLADYIVFLCKGRMLGMYEKDELMDSWKRIWLRGVEADELSGTPGVVKAEKQGDLLVCVVNGYAQVHKELSGAGIEIARVSALELDEILQELMDEEKRNKEALRV